MLVRNRKSAELAPLKKQLFELIEKPEIEKLKAFLQVENTPQIAELIKHCENEAFKVAAKDPDTTKLTIPLLLEHGFDPTTTDHFGQNALAHLLNSIPANSNMAILLIKHGADPNTKTLAGKTFFHMIAEERIELAPQYLKLARDALNEIKRNTLIETEINNNVIDINQNKVIGKGSFSKVFKGKIKDQTLAIKRIRFDDETYENSNGERRILQTLTEQGLPHIIKFYGYYTSSDAFYVLTEYCTNGSLRSVIETCERASLCAQISLMRDITQGLTYLHQLDLVHRDFNSKNIFIDENLQPKIGDFGQAFPIDGISSYMGPSLYAAPELEEKKPNDEKSDVWSLACTYWEIMAWLTFFNDIKWDYIHRQVGSFPQHIAKLVTGGWENNPDNRPTANELLKELNEIKKSPQLKQ